MVVQPSPAGGSTFSVTATADEVYPDAPAVTVPVYVPAARPVGSAVIEIVAGVEPEAGAALSHAWLSETVKLAADELLVESCAVWDEAASPSVAVKDIEVGENVRSGVVGTLF